MLMDSHVKQAIDEMSGQIRAAIDELNDRIVVNALADGSRVDVDDKNALKNLCRKLRDQRKVRSTYFPANLFHEPAWDILMALYLARIEEKVMYVKSLVVGADAPVATSQRWIEHLANLNLISRREDTADRRRIEVSLSEDGATAMENYLVEISARC